MHSYFVVNLHLQNGGILISKCFVGNVLSMAKPHQILTKYSRVIKKTFQKRVHTPSIYLLKLRKGLTLAGLWIVRHSLQ